MTGGEVMRGIPGGEVIRGRNRTVGEVMRGGNRTGGDVMRRGTGGRLKAEGVTRRKNGRGKGGDKSWGWD